MIYGCRNIYDWALFCVVVAMAATTASFFFDDFFFHGATYFFSVIVIAGMAVTWLLPRKIKDFREWRKNKNPKRRG